MTDKVDIHSLIKGCIKGKRRAQYELYRHCYTFLLPVCMRYEANEEDARATMNEGFLKILDNLSTYKPEVPFEAWCKRIMINTIIDAYRKNRNKPETVNYEEFCHNGDVAGVDLNDALQALTSEDLEKMLACLPANSRQVFNLCAIDGFTHKEVSDKLGISQGTSKWHLNYARQKLQAMVKSVMNPSQKMRL